MILAVEKIQQKDGSSLSVTMRMSIVLGQGEPGDLPGGAWECLPVKIGDVAITCLCDQLTVRDLTMKKNRDSCYRGALYALKQMMVTDLEVKHILATQGCWLARM